MTFAHWKNITINTSTLPNLAAGSDDVKLKQEESQTGPGHGPVQFIEDIPEGTAWEDVVAKWLASGVIVDDQTDGFGFSNEWPNEVRRQYDKGTGQVHKWSNLS